MTYFSIRVILEVRLRGDKRSCVRVVGESFKDTGKIISIGSEDASRQDISTYVSSTKKMNGYYKATDILTR